MGHVSTKTPTSPATTDAPICLATQGTPLVLTAATVLAGSSLIAIGMGCVAVL